MKRIDLTGEKFGRLLVLGISHVDKYGALHYRCQCDCGNKKTFAGYRVRKGKVKSCGCLHKELCVARKLPNNLAIIKRIINSYKSHAKKRNIKYNLSQNDLISIVKLNCYYCGLPPSNIQKDKNSKNGINYSGIDRLDSSKGYFLENCVPCCKICNIGKSNMTLKQFMEWITNLCIRNNGDLNES